jgi:hypothetical protein
VLAALAALLVSPSRGLFVFSPVLAFAVVGVRNARRTARPGAKLILLLASAAALLVVQYAFYREWWAGYAYGPRFLTDVVGVAALLLVYALPADPLAFMRRSVASAAAATVFTLLFGYSVAVQFAGVNSGAAGSEWNAVPVSIDRSPQRVWQVTDSQIERNMRAVYLRLFAWDLALKTDAAHRVAIDITALKPGPGRIARGTTLVASAVVRNDGQAPLFGYASGVYLGQIRIRVRMFDARGHALPDQFLYLRGPLPPGARTAATGTLTAPSTPGAYVVECDPIVVGDRSATVIAAPLRQKTQVL